MRKAVFLDRDGTINEDRPYLHKINEIVILPGVREALKKLKRLDYKLIVITNQPVVARGLATEEEVIKINDRINSQLDGMIDRFYFCPHHPNADLEKYRVACKCRKPSPGMVIQSIRDFKIDIGFSWFIGDMPSDIATGKAVGCRTILLESPNNKRIIVSANQVVNHNIVADYYAKNLPEAAEYISKW